MKQRRRSGMGTVELAISGFVGVLFACLAVDMGLMMLGNQLLDRATRDAARAAAGQTTAALAKQAANAALKNHAADGFYVTTPVLSNPDFVYEDWGGTPQGQTVPPGSGPQSGRVAQASFVSVTATNTVALPANLSMMSGALSLKMGALSTGKMTFRRTYWFPIVRQALNNAFQ
jgi:hypothetical protein